MELRANPAAHHGQGLPDMQQGKANQLAILPPAVRKHQRSRRRSLHKKKFNIRVAIKSWNLTVYAEKI